MAIAIVQLGSTRQAGEGLRIGTVRRPPRGVPKSEFTSRNYYDVWYPELSPSAPTMDLGQAAQKAGDSASWQAFERAFRKEMAQAPAARTLDLLAALSHHSAFAVGCYCETEARCHRSILRTLLSERGAAIAPNSS